MTRLEIEIQGMTRGGCARRVERALEQAGARRANVDWRRGSAAPSLPSDRVARRQEREMLGMALEEERP